MISVSNINKSFGEKHVLKAVSVDIPEGETIAIIGRSGSGKSVLMKHLIGLMQPDSGTVTDSGRGRAVAIITAWITCSM